jgi:phosphopantothenoylcysteine decarboxylase/phosphopantothenate--cysteine ligase
MSSARRMIITAGPTHEPIDNVRFIGNRSSGRMGISLAQAAHQAGWNVTLLLGPVGSVVIPDGIDVMRFTSCDDLQKLLRQQMPGTSVLVMAAAVADYRPVQRAGEAKIARGKQRITLELDPTPDLLAECASRREPGQLLVGFALESPEVLMERAQEKLRRKQVDAIVANPLSTMDAADIDATIIPATGEAVRPGPMSKAAFAQWLVQWIGQRAR